MISQTISHYKILEKLGEGGMGVVYKAQDIKLDRLVALKFLPPHLASDEQDKKRFIHEAKAASSLDHPNICNVHEIDETPDGQVFLVMAIYEGTPLNRKIEKGPLKIDEAVDVAIQAAEGLQAAHEKGIVHRDVKSSNIMITEKGRAVIMDFGLARTGGATKLTKTGSTLGTVPYMSPEQARGEKVDHRTDIWSLGIVLYEMITGRSPFRSEYNEALVYSILNEDPPPPTSLRSDVPMELERIVQKAMQKNRVSRYQHIDEMLTDLRLLKIEKSTGFVKEPLGKPMARERKRAYLYSGLAGIVVLLIVGGVHLWQSGREKKSEVIPRSDKTEAAIETKWKNSIAVLPFIDLSPQKDQEYFCDGMTEQIITSLTNIADLKVIARTSVMRFKKTEKSVIEIAEDLGVATVLEGSIRKSGNRLRITAQLIKADEGSHLWAKDYDRELKDVFAVQDDVAKAITEALKISLTGEQSAVITKRYTENTEAYQLYLKGRHFWNQRTEAGLMRSIEYFQEAIATDPMYALGYAGLADAYNILGNNWLRDPKEVFPKARTAADRALELDENLAEAHAVLGAIKFNYEWDWAGARKALRRSIELNPGYATAHQRYAWLASMLGEHNVAIDEMKLARRLDPLSARISENVGGTLFHAREYDEAILELRKALELYPNDVAAHATLGVVYVQKGMYEEAIRELRESLRSAPDAVIVLGRLGYVYAVSGDRTEAARILSKLQEIWKRARIGSACVAWIYIGLGDIDRAFQWLEKAYQDRDPAMSFMRVHPYFDPLRLDPRFRDLLLRMNLPN
ncbi:MAG: protein kinase [Bacteroidota bacterium]